MRKRPANCLECDKPINKDNPESAGGGNLDNDGKWTTWTIGRCCKKPITSPEIQDFLNKIWLATK